MSEMIRVYVDGMGMIMHKSIADERGVRDGQHVSSSLGWELLGANLSHGIAVCETMIEAESIITGDAKGDDR